MASASVVLTSDTSGSVTVTVPSGTALGTTTLTLPTSGGTIQTSGSGYTSNGVAYASSTSALATGSALTWDGTAFNISGGANPSLSLTTSSTTLYTYLGLNAGTVSAQLYTFAQSYSAVYPAGVTALANNSYGIMLNASGSTGVVTMQTNGAERMRIDSSGNLIINGTTNNGAKVNIYCTDNVSNALNVQVFSNGNNAVGFKNASGSQVGSITINSSTVTYNTSSDYRLKNTIAPMTGALAKVAQLKPVTYKWKVDGSDGQGFIAHELQAVVPECVTGEKDAVDADGNPRYQGIDTSFLVATLTSAIQELNTLITAQQSTIQSLTERITALEGART